jgi:hypothetical protein
LHQPILQRFVPGSSHGYEIPHRLGVGIGLHEVIVEVVDGRRFREVAFHFFTHTASQTSFTPSYTDSTLLAAADGSPVVQSGDHLADSIALLIQRQLLFAQLVEDPRLLWGELAPRRDKHCSIELTFINCVT